jgi:hypothetical protein
MTDELDNKLLQKIIHAPSLWDKDYPKFEKTFNIPSGMINKQKFDEEIGDIAHSKSLHNKYKKELLDISVGVQQSAKFKFNNDVTESIEAKDFGTVLSSVDTYLPFEKIYLEVRDDNANLTTSYLIEDITNTATFDLKRPKKNFLGRTKYVPFVPTDDTIFVKVSCYFVADASPDYVAIVPTPIIMPVSNTTDYNSYHSDVDCLFGAYLNGNTKQLNDIGGLIVSNIRWLQVLLSYPSLANTNSISGRKPIPYNKLGKFKASSMYSLPKWEHKVLEVDMYSSGSSGVGNGSARGKRFHAVRKHLRRLASGKSVFVKPHFRGDKSLGVIDKDYLIKGDK